MHDVRMQLLDVFRWVCPGGGEFREGGAIRSNEPVLNHNYNCAYTETKI